MLNEIEKSFLVLTKLYCFYLYLIVRYFRQNIFAVEGLYKELYFQEGEKDKECNCFLLEACIIVKNIHLQAKLLVEILPLVWLTHSGDISQKWVHNHFLRKNKHFPKYVTVEDFFQERSSY